RSGRRQAKSNSAKIAEAYPSDFLPVTFATVTENRSAIAGIAGKTYPGNFECDAEKKSRQKPAQESKKAEKGETFTGAKSFLPATMVAQSNRGVHGKTATSTTGR